MSFSSAKIDDPETYAEDRPACSTCEGSGEVECEFCDGQGHIDYDCSACNGSGAGLMGDPNTSHCTSCRGSGTDRQECYECEGTKMMACPACEGEGLEPPGVTEDRAADWAYECSKDRED